jgi:uncharacterized membrane protein YkoI
MCITRSLVLGLAAAALLGASAPARADEQGDRTGRADHSQDLDHIRDLVRAGKLLPLTTLRQRVLEKWPGELIGVTVDDEQSAIVYEFRILDDTGKMIEVEVDAATGRILEVENE